LDVHHDDQGIRYDAANGSSWLKLFEFHHLATMDPDSKADVHPFRLPRVEIHNEPAPKDLSCLTDCSGAT
jgi:hypothetical protein